VDLYTLNRSFLRQDPIDTFRSAIWTERYYGDSEVELVVPVTRESVKQLYEGVLLNLDGSNEIMIVETANIEEGDLKVVGISLLPWLNKRFVRTSAKHADQYWNLTSTPGKVLWDVVYNMCCAGSPYLSGATPTGIPNPSQLIVPGLGLKDYDKSGVSTNFAIPFGPVYDAIRDIATSYEIGMQITLESVSTSGYTLGFRSYKGLDRTSSQTANTNVRFSPQMDSLTNIKELRSIASLKTRTYAFVPTDLGALTTGLAPGVAQRSGGQYTGFDLRALMLFADDINSDMVGGSAATLKSLLDTRAAIALSNAHYIQAVDGEIVPTNQFKYGVDYNLGDIIEVQGNSDIVQTSRVTEYIRAQDEAGERAYPTVAMLS